MRVAPQTVGSLPLPGSLQADVPMPMGLPHTIDAELASEELGTVRVPEIADTLCERVAFDGTRLRKETKLYRSDPEAALRVMWDHIDVDKSGYLEREELRAVLRGIDMDIHELELDKAMCIMDANDNGAVSFSELRRWWFEQPVGSQAWYLRCRLEERLGHQRRIMTKRIKSLGMVSHKLGRAAGSVSSFLSSLTKGYVPASTTELGAKFAGAEGRGNTVIPEYLHSEIMSWRRREFRDEMNRRSGRDLWRRLRQLLRQYRLIKSTFKVGMSSTGTDEVPLFVEHDLPLTVLQPHSAFRALWEVVQAFLLVYVAFSVIYRMSFGVVITPDNAAFYVEISWVARKSRLCLL